MRLLLVVLMAMPLAAQEPAAPPAPAAANSAVQAPASVATPQETAAPATPAANPPAESPAPATEPLLTGSIDFGYRWLTDIRGSVPTYRSIVNLGDGPKLFGLDFTVQDPKKHWFDHMNVSAYGWGGDPDNTAHLDAVKSGLYDLRLDYRNIIYFNELPSFANPLAPGGFDEQSFDLHRRMFQGSLDLFPGRHIIPYLAFDRNAGYGNGVATWLTDASNEYAVPALLRDSTDNYRGGVRFEYNRFHVTLEEGGTTFKDDDQYYEGVANPGDRTSPVLGQTLLLNRLQAAYGIRGTATYSRGLVTATPVSWLTLTGAFLYSEPKTDVNYLDQASGNFVSLTTLLAYNGLFDLATGAAKQPHVTANAGFELRPWRRLRIIQSWTTDRYHDAAFGAFSALLAKSTSVVANQLTSTPDLQVVNYNREQLDLIFDATAKTTLRAGFRHIWGDATVDAGALSQAGPFATGQLKRDVALAGASFRPGQKLRVSLDFERGLSDQVYFRDSLNDYYKARARAQYQASNSLTLNATFNLLNTQNPAPTVKYDFQSQNESLSVNWTPAGGKRLRLLAEYDRTMLRSNIDYLALPFYAAALSAYRDYAHTVTSTSELVLPAVGGVTARLAFGGSVFISSGSRPTQFYQPLGRLSVPFSKHVAWNTEWRWYGMGEAFYRYEGFRVHLFTTGLRITR